MPPECEEIEIRDMLEKNEHVNQIAEKRKSPKSFTIHGRRAMLSKFWCQEIGRKWRQASRQQPPPVCLLTEPKCQPHVAVWYLFYRWVIFFVWSSLLVCSVFEFGSYNPMLAYDKWPIYLTNWDMALGFVQAFIGGMLVSKRWRLQKISGFDPSSLKWEFTERVYWFLYVVTTNLAIGVTMCYWFTVYNPEIHQLDPLNIMVHVCNSVLVLVDLFVTSIPFRLWNFWWCLSIAILYVIFTAIYYVAGGLDKLGLHYIYKVLDWKRPARTSLVSVGGCTFIMVLHCVSCVLADIRNRIYNKITRKSSQFARTNDNPLSDKGTSLPVAGLTEV
ncbi:protein rolling stone-like isoform X2 [Pseudomyrmex gracilis]|uniref:protein rolling stone-like isoform X2 n=1 Tax=Pseudomyrmex gracilis TaxID=219809 RepID=UPI000994BCDB|nr:protein rolling stone-like isoform X2 [Pseudomyrmex gracilis]